MLLLHSADYYDQTDSNNIDHHWTTVK